MVLLPASVRVCVRWVLYNFFYFKKMFLFILIKNQFCSGLTSRRNQTNKAAGQDTTTPHGSTAPRGTAQWSRAPKESREAQQHRTGRRGQGTHSTTPQDAHGTKHNTRQQHTTAKHTQRGETRQNTAPKTQDPRTTDSAPRHDTARESTKQSKTKQHSAQQCNARRHDTQQCGAAQHPGAHHSTPPKYDTRTHQDPTGDNRGQPGPTANTQTQRTTTQNAGQRRRGKRATHREQRLKHTGTAPHKQSTETETVRSTTERQGTTKKEPAENAAVLDSKAQHKQQNKTHHNTAQEPNQTQARHTTPGTAQNTPQTAAPHDKAPDEAKHGAPQPAARETSKTQRQGPGHPGPETRKRQRQRGHTTKKNPAFRTPSSQSSNLQPFSPSTAVMWYLGIHWWYEPEGFGYYHCWFWIPEPREPSPEVLWYLD